MVQHLLFLFIYDGLLRRAGLREGDIGPQWVPLHWGTTTDLLSTFILSSSRVVFESEPCLHSPELWTTTSAGPFFRWNWNIL